MSLLLALVTVNDAPDDPDTKVIASLLPEAVTAVSYG
jgi:hypothetical protein